VSNADRAGNIIDRIRDHVRKAPARKHRFDLNEAINEVIVLARSAIVKNGILVQTRLTEELAPIQGDRVQLQQGPELDPERGRSNGLGRGGATRAADRHRAKPDRWRPSIIHANGGQLWADANKPRGAVFQFSLLQRELAAANKEFPIIFMTGHGDIRMSVQAMKGGAIEFLTKPFRDQDLIDAIQLGLARDRTRRENEGALAGLRERFGSLSPRERQIMIEVARGRLSKQIAGDIGISEPTVKVHRSRAMRKMKARTLPEFGRMAVKLKLIPEGPHHS
jgi:FixJ family two-component response regulator